MIHFDALLDCLRFCILILTIDFDDCLYGSFFFCLSINKFNKFKFVHLYPPVTEEAPLVLICVTKNPRSTDACVLDDGAE